MGNFKTKVIYKEKDPRKPVSIGSKGTVAGKVKGIVDNQLVIEFIDFPTTTAESLKKCDVSQNHKK